ncbi:hypothetical protein SARC_07172 [Sphaeroforma arctica JP610]|uniref:Uncharacterized protein n=1 Tax=Sphaeroforma arctica JP610 TaxID=667725 RepID=A0A0L0FV04_9EUKA|nr:hypothetical protein SARC_07172 [Sphaeroforma arctica JP610]KNC80469.1 hypothetical protein SARC_07172 [Sphaeroforma arctica JP610]|eukprot:XP_014154371.1 hypothetical protein SARC_07172 [Sphaeroforma arctica JP610]
MSITARRLLVLTTRANTNSDTDALKDTRLGAGKAIQSNPQDTTQCKPEPNQQLHPCLQASACVDNLVTDAAVLRVLEKVLETSQCIHRESTQPSLSRMLKGHRKGLTKECERLYKKGWMIPEELAQAVVAIKAKVRSLPAKRDNRKAANEFIAFMDLSEASAVLEQTANEVQSTAGSSDETKSPELWDFVWIHRGSLPSPMSDEGRSMYTAIKSTIGERNGRVVLVQLECAAGSAPLVVCSPQLPALGQGQTEKAQPCGLENSACKDTGNHMGACMGVGTSAGLDQNPGAATGASRVVKVEGVVHALGDMDKSDKENVEEANIRGCATAVDAGGRGRHAQGDLKHGSVLVAKDTQQHKCYISPAVACDASVWGMLLNAYVFSEKVPCKDTRDVLGVSKNSTPSASRLTSRNNTPAATPQGTPAASPRGSPSVPEPDHATTPYTWSQTNTVARRQSLVRCYFTTPHATTPRRGRTPAVHGSTDCGNKRAWSELKIEPCAHTSTDESAVKLKAQKTTSTGRPMSGATKLTPGSGIPKIIRSKLTPKAQASISHAPLPSLTMTQRAKLKDLEARMQRFLAQTPLGCRGRQILALLVIPPEIRGCRGGDMGMSVGRDMGKGVGRGVGRRVGNGVGKGVGRGVGGFKLGEGGGRKGPNTVHPQTAPQTADAPPKAPRAGGRGTVYAQLVSTKAAKPDKPRPVLGKISSNISHGTAGNQGLDRHKTLPPKNPRALNPLAAVHEAKRYSAHDADSVGVTLVPSDVDENGNVCTQSRDRKGDMARNKASGGNTYTYSNTYSNTTNPASTYNTSIPAPTQTQPHNPTAATGTQTQPKPNTTPQTRAHEGVLLEVYSSLDMLDVVGTQLDSWLTADCYEAMWPATNTTLTAQWLQDLVDSGAKMGMKGMDTPWIGLLARERIVEIANGWDPAFEPDHTNAATTKDVTVQPHGDESVAQRRTYTGKTCLIYAAPDKRLLVHVLKPPLTEDDKGSTEVKPIDSGQTDDCVALGTQQTKFAVGTITAHIQQSACGTTGRAD